MMTGSRDVEDNSPTIRKRRKKSLKRRLKGRFARSRTRDTLIYVAVALALGYFAGIMILRYLAE